METTQLYIELIIVGLETSIWICGFFVNIVGNRVFEISTGILRNIASSVLLIGIFYIIGILLDRLADFIFQKSEDKIRQASGLKAKTSMLVWNNLDNSNFFGYIRSRIRILRASVLNIPLITVSFAIYAARAQQLLLVLYILVLGVGFSIISYKGYMKSVKTYYNKIRVLELSQEQDDKAGSQPEADSGAD